MFSHILKNVVKDVPILHFGENGFLVNLRTLEVGLHFCKILSDLTPPQTGLCMDDLGGQISILLQTCSSIVICFDFQNTDLFYVGVC